LERAGHEVCFIDGAALNLTAENVAEQVERFEPEMTVIHTTTPSIYSDLEYAKLIKERSNAYTILVGPHVTALPEDTFSHSEKNVDVIALGEYDETLLDLAELR